MRRDKTIRKGSKFLVGVVLILGATSFVTQVSNWHAQEVAATVVGMVKDASGAIMPKVKVTVTNVSTNVAHTTTSNDSGSYLVGALNPGEYRITAEAQGFKTEVINGIVLQVNQTARIDITMQPGLVVQHVEVTGVGPVINTENPEIGSVVEENRIVNLPLNGRNFMELTTLSAGINEAQPSTQKTYATFAPSAAGQPATENNYTLDGVDNKNHYFNTYAVAPSVDAIQEFGIQIGQYSAEFGSGGGAVINAVTKSGTNQFNGSAYEFFRNQVLDARNFFAATRSPLRQNQFGGTFGGPFKKNKAFFFVNYDGTRSRAPGTAVQTVPTTAEINGDLSALGKTITNPFTGQPFPGAVIPTNLISPISTGILGYYPAPNVPGVQVSNFVRSFSNQIDINAFLTRVDFALSQKNTLMARYAYQNINQVYPGPFPLVGGYRNPELYQNLAIGWTSNVTPNFVNQFRFGYGRWNNFAAGQNQGNPIAQKLGLMFHSASPVDAGFVQQVTLNTTIFNGIGETYPFLILNNTFQWYDGITWVHGKHTVKAGANIMRNRDITDCAVDANGAYTFSGQYTGDGFADFLLGYPNQLTATLTPPARIHAFQTQQAYYVLDDWKVSPKLTLNLGLRYEFDQYPWDKEGASVVFDPSLGGGVGGLLYPPQNKTAQPFYTQERPDLPFGFLNRKSALLPDKDNFAPRFGFAYRPFNDTRTVVRGGYGWYYSSPQTINLEGNLDFSPPTYVTPNFYGNPTVPNVTWNGVPGVPPADFVKSLTFGVLSGPEQQFLNGYTQQWSLGVAREVSRNTSVEVQYLGSKSSHIEDSFDYNWTAPSPLPLATRLPYPAWGRLYGFDSGAAATYNALLVSAQRRFAKGFSFQAAYTYGKAICTFGGRQYYANGSYLQNPGERRLEKGPIGDDVTNRFVISYIYDLPFGPGQHFAGNTQGIAGKVIGGWSVSGITTLRTGFTIFGPLVSTANCNSAFCNFCRPDLIGNPMLNSNGVNTPRYNVAAFDWPLNPAHAPENPRFGNSQPNLLRGNDLNLWNLALLKDTRFHERFDLQFRFEMFNFPNHPNFGDPCGYADSPNFGRTFSTAAGSAGNGRDLQFGLKLYW